MEFDIELFTRMLNTVCKHLTAKYYSDIKAKDLIEVNTKRILFTIYVYFPKPDMLDMCFRFTVNKSITQSELIKKLDPIIKAFHESY